MDKRTHFVGVKFNDAEYRALHRVIKARNNEFKRLNPGIKRTLTVADIAREQIARLDPAAQEKPGLTRLNPVRRIA